MNCLCLHIYNQTLDKAKKFPVEENTLPQIKAWQNCIHNLKEQLIPLQHIEAYLIFEYDIPRIGGRRPDVLLPLPGELIVLEFKSYDNIS